MAGQIRSKNWADFLQERLQDANEAASYLNAALADPDYRVFLLAVRDVAMARGGLARVANDTGLNRENLYRMLSRNGNPRIDSLNTVLSDLGLRLAVDVARPSRRRPAKRG